MSKKTVTFAQVLSAVGLLLTAAVLAIAAYAQNGNEPVSPRRNSPTPSNPTLPGQLNSATLPSDMDENGNLSADEIIAILRRDPQAMAETRRALARQLRDQGHYVAEDQITDEYVVNRIRSDEKTRVAVSRQLQRRITTDEEEPTVARPGTVGAPAVPPPPALSAPTEEAPATNRPSFYGEIPSLQDLYSQVPKQQGTLERFGSSLFKSGNFSREELLADIPVGPDYVLGIGDSLDVSVWGSTSQRWRRTIDTQGRVVLPEAGPLMLAGKTLQQAQQMVETALKRQLVGINAEVSLAGLRTVRVYVVGDVARPGAYNISALSTPLNALYAAGGPTEHGSLRMVRHLRGKTLVGEFDIYDLLLKGIRNDVQRLESGDSILIPPAGPQVTVAGMVRRPAIYELNGEKGLSEVIALAGGVLVSGSLGQITVERIEAHQSRVMLSLNGDRGNLNRELPAFAMQDGDRVTIRSILPFSERSVYLEGHVFRPGKEPYRDGMKLTDLVHGFNDLLPEPADRAEIIRLVPPEMRPVALSFSLPGALKGTGENPTLQPFDTVRIYGRYEVDAPKVSIFGEVMRPGEYPLADGMTASQLLQLAGGFKRSAFRDVADLASYVVAQNERISTEHREVPIARALAGETDTDVRLKPGDVLTVRQLTGWNDIGASILVAGEVFHPGTYGIQEGERLSSVLRRAGGLRPTAYPNGAVLEREQVRELDRKTRETLVRRIRGSQVPVQTTNVSEQTAIDSAFAAQQQQIVSRLANEPANGRLIIRISEDMSKWENTAADIEVRAGDQIVIPKRPGFVMVNGQVNNPSAISYVPGKSASFYLERAGGATSFGNKRGVFIVRANGLVVGNSGSGWWRGNVLGTTLQPGDSVVVPEKILGGGILQRNLLNTAQVLSNLAVAARIALSF